MEQHILASRCVFTVTPNDNYESLSLIIATLCLDTIVPSSGENHKPLQVQYAAVVAINVPVQKILK